MRVRLRVALFTRGGASSRILEHVATFGNSPPKVHRYPILHRDQHTQFVNLLELLRLESEVRDRLYGAIGTVMKTCTLHVAFLQIFYTFHLICFFPAAGLQPAQLNRPTSASLLVQQCLVQQSRKCPAPSCFADPRWIQHCDKGRSRSRSANNSPKSQQELVPTRRLFHQQHTRNEGHHEPMAFTQIFCLHVE